MNIDKLVVSCSENTKMTALMQIFTFEVAFFVFAVFPCIKAYGHKGSNKF